jgi:tetratricopeptide (TPR) repeat protein
MNGKTFIPLILSAIILSLSAPAISQDGTEPSNTVAADSIECGKYLSTYREFLKYEIYQYAREPWRNAFEKCPSSSEKMYVDGVTIYRHDIEELPDGPVREGLIDTLMLIYDRRMQYFGGEGNVMGRKGIDLLTYRRTDTESVREAYTLLKKSIELEGEKTRDVVMLNFFSAGIALENKEIIDKTQIIEDHFMVTAILEKLEERSSRWKRTRETIDEIMKKERIFTCEAIDAYFTPRFGEHKSDLSFLEKMTSYYAASDCKQSEIQLDALEQLYKLAPGPETAHQLAILYLNTGDMTKASDYLKMAVVGENIDSETRAAWFFELAVVSAANKDYCDAISYAREAISNKPEYGKAYMALGDAIIASRSNLGDDFEKRTAYWAAADKYTEAALSDPSLDAEARQKLKDYRDQYPSKEDVFFRDLKEGDAYLVGGCINEYTSVRVRD